MRIRGLRKVFDGRAVLDGVDLEQPDAGEISVSSAAMVFQGIHLVNRRSAIDNVCTGALGRLSFGRSLFFPHDLRAEAMRCLDRVGMADRAAERCARLPGGQRQRVAIARALCQRAAVILADEPVSALDTVSARQVVGLLSDLASDGLAVVAVLHQPSLAEEFAHRIVGLHNGRATADLSSVYEVTR